MDIFTWLIGIYVSIYTFGYARIVYKEGNKKGAAFVAILSIAVIVLPYWVTNN